MHLLDTWLQRNDDRLTVIQVDAGAPAASQRRYWRPFDSQSREWLVGALGLRRDGVG